MPDKHPQSYQLGYFHKTAVLVSYSSSCREFGVEEPACCESCQSMKSSTFSARKQEEMDQEKSTERLAFNGLKEKA